jgi:hypothetical protein
MMYKFIQLFEMDELLTILFSFHYDIMNVYASKHTSICPSELQKRDQSVLLVSHCQYVNN